MQRYLLLQAIEDLLPDANKIIQGDSRVLHEVVAVFLQVKVVLSLQLRIPDHWLSEELKMYFWVTFFSREKPLLVVVDSFKDVSEALDELVLLHVVPGATQVLFELVTCL